jgi:hypothetical protein
VTEQAAVAVLLAQIRNSQTGLDELDNEPETDGTIFLGQQWGQSRQSPVSCQDGKLE